MSWCYAYKVENYRNLQNLAIPTRELILRMNHRASSSHIGSSYSVLDLLICIYSYVDMNPLNKIILSKGHAAAAFYAVLSAFNRISDDLIGVYCKDGEKYAGHVSHLVHPDITLSTGSLGHGLPYGAGIALSKKESRETEKVYVIMSDGEMDEGTTWESALFANHFNLNNLIVVVDRNRLQSLTTTEETIKLEPLLDKWEAFGWQTYEINGHSYSEIMNLLESINDKQLKPVCIIANTIKGFGISFMENSVKWHYKSPDDNELRLGISELENNS
jgi:transketolase